MRSSCTFGLRHLPSMDIQSCRERRQIPKSFRKGNVIFLFFGITTVGRELLEYAVVALLVSLVKIASGHGFADAEVIKFSGMRFHRNNEIPQALSI